MSSYKNISIGSWITLNHFSVVEIMAEAGFDWLCIDLEHSVIDYYDAEILIATIQAKGIKPFVRVGENNEIIIKRVLDAGAEGIIIPMVNSKSDAIKAVNAVKYPPQGTRGVGLARAQNYGFNFEEYAKNINDQTIIIAQIEHIDGINNLNEILAVEGINGSIIGPYDLSGSLGKPGRYNDQDVRNMLLKYEEISREFDKPFGYHVINPDHLLVLDKIKSGYSFLAFSLDTLFFGTIVRQEMKKLRKALK